MQTLVLTIFWMFGILWATYRWYGSPNTANNNNNNNKPPKVVFDFDPDRRHSTSSIESLEHDNECIRRRKKNMQKLKQIKTCWPSKTSLKRRCYKSF